MKNALKWFAMSLLVGLLGSSLAWAAGDAAKGKALYATCVACHGVNGEGNQALNAPMIAGQETWYLERQLKNFKAGIRGGEPNDIYGTQMRPMSMLLADDQAIADVAAYISSLKMVPAPATITGDAAAGKAKYATCMACHGANGEGNQALNAPRLKGQHDWYSVRQLQNFKKGIRGANPKDVYGAQMRPMAMILSTDKDIQDVVSYINTLK